MTESVGIPLGSPIASNGDIGIGKILFDNCTFRRICQPKWTSGVLLNAE